MLGAKPTYGVTRTLGPMVRFDGTLWISKKSYELCNREVPRTYPSKDSANISVWLAAIVLPMAQRKQWDISKESVLVLITRSMA
jgi:hypothetical protein